MPLTKEEAQALLLKVVTEWWSDTERPLLGSQLKVRMLERAPDFDQRDFQYRSFGAFVRDAPGLKVETRGTTDFAVAPADQAAAFVQHGKPVRIRPHFWRAFVSFQRENEVRGYNVDTGFVFIGPSDKLPSDAVTIQPISKQEQLDWRRQFIESQEDLELKNLLPELTLDGGFKAFTVALEARPALRRRWHSVLQAHVAQKIGAWAKPLHLNDSVWLDTDIQSTTTDLVRQQIYALIEELRTEDLLELQIPIRMLLKSGQRKPQ